MKEININVKYVLPDLELSEKDQLYLNELIAEVTEEEGSTGLIIALETYLGK